MLFHCIGERGAAFDIGAHLQNGRAEVLVLFLRAENLETLHERQTGVDHDGELTGENREVLRRGRFRLRLLRRSRSLRGRRRDPRDHDLFTTQRRHDRVHGVAHPLAADVFAAASSTNKCKRRHSATSRQDERLRRRPDAPSRLRAPRPRRD
jgi:hypothetical protein